jgi:hypothetical protein
MTYPEEAYHDPLLREKMKKWGIIIDEPSDVITISSFLSASGFGQFLRAEPTEEINVPNEIRNLRKRVRELERRVGGKREPTKVDFVYELHKEELEENYFGKIVAIDTELGEIVGRGDTILEAYKKAKEKTGKDQFDFRRVGYKYLDKV